MAWQKVRQSVDLSPISKLNFQVSDVLRLIISGSSINESASSGISSGSDGESAEPKREKLYNSRPAPSSSNSTAPVPVPSTSSMAPAPVPSSSNVMSQIRRFFRPSTSIMSVSFIKHCLKLYLTTAFYFSAWSLKFDFKFYDRSAKILIPRTIWSCPFNPFGPVHLIHLVLSI